VDQKSRHIGLLFWSTLYATVKNWRDLETGAYSSTALIVLVRPVYAEGGTGVETPRERQRRANSQAQSGPRFVSEITDCVGFFQGHSG